MYLTIKIICNTMLVYCLHTGKITYMCTLLHAVLILLDTPCQLPKHTDLGRFNEPPTTHSTEKTLRCLYIQSFQWPDTINSHWYVIHILTQFFEHHKQLHALFRESFGWQNIKQGIATSSFSSNEHVQLLLVKDVTCYMLHVKDTV